MDPEQLGSYRIIERLGAGGMATVYRAHDERLDREVALKRVAPELLEDPTSIARFLREARAAATLNHPHICTVYEVGEAGGQPFIAMELIDGRPLGETVPAGGLPAETVLRHGAAIAAALAHAHQRGVVHRDLKSANVVVSRDGNAKVVDFGLARRVSPAGVRDASLTRTDALVGTPHYMAPELLTGAEATPRSDLWALGVVLHEMASGELPFPGSTAIEVGAAVLQAAPRPLPDRVPAGLRAVILRLLAKDPTQRFGTAGEAQAALEALQSGGVVAPPPRARAGARPRVPAWVFVAAGVAILAISVWFASRRSSAPEPTVTQRQVTSNAEGNFVYVTAVSPDGRYVAFVDTTGTWVRLIATGETRRVTLPEGFHFTLPGGWVDWFPDGTRLLLSGMMSDQAQTVWSVPLAGGRPSRITDGSAAVMAPDGRHIAFVRDGAAGSDLWVADADGSAARRLVPSDSTGVVTMMAPGWSPRGGRVAYGRRVLAADGGWRTRLESADLAGRVRVMIADSAAVRLHDLPGLAWLPDGRVVFALAEPAPNEADMNLWTMRVDPERGVPSGRPRRLTQWIRASYPELGTCSADGRTLGVTLLQYPTDIYVGEIAGPRAPLRDVRRLTLDSRDDDFPAWTPDGAAVLYASDVNGDFDVFSQRVDRTTPETLVQGPGNQFGARITTDGRWLLYWDDQGGGRLMRMPVAGGGRDSVPGTSRGVGFRFAPGPPARGVMVEVTRGALLFKALDPAAGAGAVLATVPGNAALAWDLSPDGRSIVVGAVEDSSARVRVIPIGGAPPHDVRLDMPMRVLGVQWAPDGTGWFAYGPGREGWLIVRIDQAGHCTRLVPLQPWLRGIAVSPDGRRFAFTRNNTQSSGWVLQGL